MRTFLKVVFVLYAAVFVLAVTTAFVDLPAHGPYKGMISVLIQREAGFPWVLVLIGVLKGDFAIKIACLIASALNLFVLQRLAYSKPRPE